MFINQDIRSKKIKRKAGNSCNHSEDMTFFSDPSFFEQVINQEMKEFIDFVERKCFCHFLVRYIRLKFMIE